MKQLSILKITPCIFNFSSVPNNLSTWSFFSSGRTNPKHPLANLLLILLYDIFISLPYNKRLFCFLCFFFPFFFTLSLLKTRCPYYENTTVFNKHFNIFRFHQYSAKRKIASMICHRYTIGRCLICL